MRTFSLRTVLGTVLCAVGHGLQHWHTAVQRIDAQSVMPRAFGGTKNDVNRLAFFGDVVLKDALCREMEARLTDRPPMSNGEMTIWIQAAESNRVMAMHLEQLLPSMELPPRALRFAHIHDCGTLLEAVVKKVAPDDVAIGELAGFLLDACEKGRGGRVTTQKEKVEKKRLLVELALKTVDDARTSFESVTLERISPTQSQAANQAANLKGGETLQDWFRRKPDSMHRVQMAPSVFPEVFAVNVWVGEGKGGSGVCPDRHRFVALARVEVRAHAPPNGASNSQTRRAKNLSPALFVSSSNKSTNKAQKSCAMQAHDYIMRFVKGEN